MSELLDWLIVIAVYVLPFIAVVVWLVLIVPGLARGA